MQHHVSKSYLADRRRGPRIVSIMMIFIFCLLAFLTYRQDRQLENESTMRSLLFAGGMMAAVGIFATRRVSKITGELENIVFTVSVDGFRAESGSETTILKASEIQKIIMYRIVFAPKIVFFVVAGKSRATAIPPLEFPDAFAQEIQAMLPKIQFARKRKLIANFGG